MKEYTYSKSMKILASIFCPLLIILFTRLLLEPVFPFKDTFSISVYWILFVPFLAMLILSIVGLRDVFKAKFVIERDRIYSQSTFYYRELLFNEIEGYRTDDKYLYILPNTSEKKKIRLGVQYFPVEGIMEWLQANYKDLDLNEREEKEKTILLDETLGSTEEEREGKLSAARKAAKLINITGVAIAAWALFSPSPYMLVISACIIFPFIAIIVMKFFNGLIHLNEQKTSPYPSVVYGLGGPCMIIGLRGLLDFSIFNYEHVWLPMVLLSILMSVFLVIGNKEFKGKSTTILVMIGALFIFSFYSYGTIVTLNCRLDEAPSKHFHSQVLDKHIGSGKSKTRYLKLSPWGPQTEEEDVEVSKNTYARLEVKDSVSVFLMPGKFDIPWVEVTGYLPY